MGKNKIVTFRMDEESYEKLQRFLQKQGLTVTDFFVQKAEEYLNNTVLDEEDELSGNKLITMAMHSALYYALQFQRNEIEKAFVEAEEQTRYLYDDGDTQKSCHVILTQAGKVFVEDNIPRSLREALRKGEALILFTFKPACILEESITTEWLIECLYFNEKANEKQEFFGFLAQYIDVNDENEVEDVLRKCSPQEVIAYIWEYQHESNVNSNLYNDMWNDLENEFELNSSRVEDAEEALSNININEFEIIC